MVAVKDVVFLVLYTSTWMVFLPLVVAGGIALFAYALVAELGDHLFSGECNGASDASAREIAALICSRG